jgi:hypothetical protein
VQSFLKLGRRFLREGTLTQYVSDSMRSKQRYLFLFSDIILLTQPRRSSAVSLLKKAAPKYQFMASVDLERCKVIGPEEVSVPGVKHAIKLLLADGSSWILHHASDREVASWYRSLKDAIDEAQASMISKHQSRPTRFTPRALSLCMRGELVRSDVVPPVCCHHVQIAAAEARADRDRAGRERRDRIDVPHTSHHDGCRARQSGAIGNEFDRAPAHDAVGQVRSAERHAAADAHAAATARSAGAVVDPRLPDATAAAAALRPAHVATQAHPASTTSGVALVR